MSLVNYLCDPVANLAVPELAIKSSTTNGYKLVPAGLDAITANAELGVGASTATDLRLNGATAGRDVLWDASADTLYVQDNAVLAVGTGGDLTATSGGANVAIAAPNGTLDIQGSGAVTIDSSAGAIGIGTDADAQAINIGTGAAVRTITVGNVTGATGVVLNAGTAGVNVPLAAPVTHSAGFLVPCYSTTVHGLGVTVGAIPLVPSFSGLTTTGADAFTLAAPGAAVPPGYIKDIRLTVDGGDATVTVTGLAAANDVITLSELGQGVKLMAVDAATWIIVEINDGDTTVSSIPAFA